MKIRSQLLTKSLFLSLPALCFFATEKTYAQSEKLILLSPPQIKIECKNTFFNTEDALPADVFEAASEEIGGTCHVNVQLQSFDGKKTALYRLSCTTDAEGSCIAYQGTVGKMVRDYNIQRPTRDSNRLSIAYVPQPKLNPKQTEILKIIPGFSSVRYFDYISDSLNEHCTSLLDSDDSNPLAQSPVGPSYESITHRGLIDTHEVMTRAYSFYRNFETSAFVTNEISLGCRNPLLAF